MGNTRPYMVFWWGEQKKNRNESIKEQRDRKRVEFY
jgi:hypothetical protein